jgi:hypothetical protein
MITVLAILKVVWILIAFGSWVAGVFYGIKAVRHARPDISIWGRKTLWNPANVLVIPGLLTNEGKKYRRRCFIAVIVFVILIVLPTFIDPLAGR